MEARNSNSCCGVRCRFTFILNQHLAIQENFMVNIWIYIYIYTPIIIFFLILYYFMLSNNWEVWPTNRLIFMSYQQNFHTCNHSYNYISKINSHQFAYQPACNNGRLYVRWLELKKRHNHFELLWVNKNYYNSGPMSNIET